jgi:hypothetical protein
MLNKLKKWLWSGVHNCIAHPLLWLSFEAYWADDFHDWSAEKAWPELYDVE